MYKQTQGRKNFPKTGRGITSKLAGPGPEPKFTKEGLEARLKQVGTNVSKGKAEMGYEQTGSQMQRLFNIASGNNVKQNYSLYRKDSTAAANTPINSYYPTREQKEAAQKISDVSPGFFDEILDKKKK